jgi:hypothetical protein
LGASTSPEEHLREVEEWHAGRIERLRSPTGWLSLVGLMRLSEGSNTLGSAEDAQLRLPDSAPAHVGTIILQDRQVRLEGAKGAVLVDGKPAGDVVVLNPDASDRGESTTICDLGSLQFFVIDRPGGFLLRVKDAEAPLLKNFDGKIERWPVDQRWQIHAQWIPYDPPKVLTIANEIGFTEEETLEGYLRFRIDDTEYTIDPLRVGDELFIIFADETSGVESYGAGRYFYTDLPDEEGAVIMDFNKAYNMPCVFTSFATCSLPPRGNRLPIKATAGEKMWQGEKN